MIKLDEYMTKNRFIERIASKHSVPKCGYWTNSELFEFVKNIKSLNVDFDDFDKYVRPFASLSDGVVRKINYGKNSFGYTESYGAKTYGKFADMSTAQLYLLGMYVRDVILRLIRNKFDAEYEQYQADVEKAAGDDFSPSDFVQLYPNVVKEPNEYEIAWKIVKQIDAEIGENA